MLRSAQGKEWYKQWREGVIDDEMVQRKWGEDVKELFHATLAMELSVSDVKNDMKEEKAEGGTDDNDSDMGGCGRNSAEGAEERPGHIPIEEADGDEN